MSWDIGIEVNGEHFENADWNYTHNCNEMMRDAGYDWVYHFTSWRCACCKATWTWMILRWERLHNSHSRK